MEQPRGGGGVRALTGQLRQRPDPQVDLRQQAVDQRGFTHARLPHKHADTAVELLLQLLHAVAVMSRYFQHRVAQLAINPQQCIQSGCVLIVDQVCLVQQQERADPGVLGSHQVTVDQVGVRLGHWREDDHDHVDVGRDRLELATVVGAAQFGFARQLGDDHADALIACAPHHGVTGDQCGQVGAQVATERLAFQLAFLSLDFDLHTEVRDHQAELLGA